MKQEEKPPFTVEEPDLSGTYTAREYLTWQMDELVELIKGKIFKMSPSPTSNHQRISLQLGKIFDRNFQKKKCEVFIAPLDVYLVKPGEDYQQTRNVVEPDLFVVCEPEKIKPFGCVGAPDLVIEILSKSTAQKDRKLKFDLYEEYGVKEYWMVSPETKSVVVNMLEKGKYKTLRPVKEDEKLTSVIFPELVVDLKEVFTRVK